MGGVEPGSQDDHLGHGEGLIGAEGAVGIAGEPAGVGGGDDKVIVPVPLGYVGEGHVLPLLQGELAKAVVVAEADGHVPVGVLLGDGQGEGAGLLRGDGEILIVVVDLIRGKELGHLPLGGDGGIVVGGAALGEVDVQAPQVPLAQVSRAHSQFAARLQALAGDGELNPFDGDGAQDVGLRLGGGSGDQGHPQAQGQGKGGGDHAGNAFLHSSALLFLSFCGNASQFQFSISPQDAFRLPVL